MCVRPGGCAARGEEDGEAKHSPVVAFVRRDADGLQTDRGGGGRAREDRLPQRLDRTAPGIALALTCFDLL